MPTVCGIYARQRPTPPCKGSSRSRPESSHIPSPCAHRGLWGRVRGKMRGMGGQLERQREDKIRKGRGRRERTPPDSGSDILAR